MSTLPRIRIESRGGKLRIKADTLPRKTAVKGYTRKESVAERPKTPKTQPKSKSLRHNTNSNRSQATM
ncbi:hypothetical protein GWI33_023344 [Rhynchophorus ferrugineus]|uniref:Uncharacterized protein n=1 Tax=Rhynchophorus ferrugineus TaxID=354439 RepID=A0A834M1R6_RHYFE|nr:hypothetical protein GWI33_023344 [Rhynchophorus ferrugineus]